MDLDKRPALDELVDEIRADVAALAAVTRPPGPLTVDDLVSEPHLLYRVDFDRSTGYNDDEVRTDCDPADANVIASELADRPGWHTVMLDLDLPARLVPSSTPGHSHLYIDAAVPWDKYAALLRALADADVIEDGYANASIVRGHTALRLPWISKETPANGN